MAAHPEMDFSKAKFSWDLSWEKKTTCTIPHISAVTWFFYHFQLSVVSQWFMYILYCQLFWLDTIYLHICLNMIGWLVYNHYLMVHHSFQADLIFVCSINGMLNKIWQKRQPKQLNQSWLQLTPTKPIIDRLIWNMYYFRYLSSQLLLVNLWHRFC